MRVHFGAALLLGATFTMAGCQSQGGSASLDTDDAKASYAIGRSVGTNLMPAQGRVEMDALVQGLEDALAERESPLPDDTMRAVMQRFTEAVQQDQQEQREAEAQANLESGSAFLEENAAKEGVVTTESGLQYEVLEEGSGPRPSPQDSVKVNYTGTLPDGTVFDSSDEGEPSVFQVSRVIKGFAEGLQLMPVGSTYRFVIPGDLAYGARGRPGAIPPNQVLVFEVELLDIMDE